MSNPSKVGLFINADSETVTGQNGSGQNRTDKIVWTRWYTDIMVFDKMVYGENGSGENGAEKMVWTKWYTNKMILNEMVWRKWYGHNSTDKMVAILGQFIIQLNSIRI